MDRLAQDFVVRLKYTHEKYGMFEFIIPNNTPTIEALEALSVWQKILLASLKPKELEPKPESEEQV